MLLKLIDFSSPTDRLDFKNDLNGAGVDSFSTKLSSVTTDALVYYTSGPNSERKIRCMILGLYIGIMEKKMETTII